MAGLVIDASITMTWCFDEEATTESDDVLRRLREDSAAVPVHWSLEVANVLAIAERRNRLSASASAEFLRRVETFSLEIDDEGAERAFSHILPLARDYRLTVYDAAYVDLALRRRLPLATLDSEMRAAAKKLNVPLLGM